MRMSILLSRGIVGLFYLYSGINGFFNMDDKIDQIASKGVPMPNVIVPISLLMLLIAGVTITTGYEIRLGVIALALFILPVTIFVHDFWNIADSVRRISEWNGLQSSLALLAYGEATRQQNADARGRPRAIRKARLMRLGRRLLAAMLGCRFERTMWARRASSASQGGQGLAPRRRSAARLANVSSPGGYPRRVRRRVGEPHPPR